VPDHVEDAIVEARKRLEGWGLDAGPGTIRWHLRGPVSPLPSEATIWRVLRRRGFITPAPKKRPRSSYRRFEAERPNECWQIDATDWALAGGAHAEIINIVDDHSRLAVASWAVTSTTTEAAWEVFDAAAARWGLPTRCLSDNGLAFSGRLRGFEVAFEANLRTSGVRAVTARPYHPQTCGKVERYQQTLKRWLRARSAAATLVELQRHLDAFCEHYNHRRPHRAIGRRVPFEAWVATAPSGPQGPAPLASARGVRLVSRRGAISVGGHQVGVGMRLAGQRLEVVTDGAHAAVLVDGELLRRIDIDAGRGYRGSGERSGPRRRDGT
jgi:transposase InsO family protein